MDINGLLSGSIEELVAAIPQIVIVLTTIIYSLNAIKSKVSVYPKIASDTKEDINLNLASIKGKIEGILNVSQEKVNIMLEETKSGLFKTAEESKEGLITLVSKANETAQSYLKNTLDVMEVELNSYKKQLITNIEQTNLLTRQNKLFMDVILELIAKDPLKVSEGITQAVSTKINLTKEELEHYPEVLIKDMGVLTSALKEAFALMGKESFDKLLTQIGYGKEND